jgi:hypothetical protein
MTDDFEIDDMLHRHGKEIAKALVPPVPKSWVHRSVVWLFSRNADKYEKRVAIFALCAVLFAMWATCLLLAEYIYAVNESPAVQARDNFTKMAEYHEHMARIFRAMAEASRKAEKASK